MAKACANETISAGSFQLLSLYYEIVLNFPALNKSPSVVSMPTAASFAPSSSAFNYDPTIIVSFVIAGNNYFTTINNLMNQKYNSCVNGVGVAGLARTGRTAACNSIDAPQGNITSGVQNVLFNGLEVDDHPLSSPPITVMSGGAPISSIVTSDVDNRTLMFIGRTDGTLMTVSSFCMLVYQCTYTETVCIRG